MTRAQMKVVADMDREAWEAYSRGDAVTANVLWPFVKRFEEALFEDDNDNDMKEFQHGVLPD